MKVRNFTNYNGRAVLNQFIIADDNGREIFQSYDSVIAIKGPDGVTLDEFYWNYSRTTGRYRNIFLEENKRETEKKIRAGIYKLANLNG